MKVEYYGPKLTRREKWLVALALLGCAGNLMPLLLYFLNLWPMKLAAEFFLPPSLLLLLALAVYAAKKPAPLFWHRYATGFIGGLIGTLAYDFIRVFGLAVKFPGFDVINKFGMLMVGENEFSFTAGVLGWGYHFMNGGVFGITFAFLAGPRANAWWGIAWSMLLEIAMVITYPAAFKLNMGWGTAALTFSILGHVGYGAVLGSYIRKKSWKISGIG